MDLHPILVHFPIALLTVYSGLEIVRLPTLSQRPSWQNAKAWFVVVGGAIAPITYFSGRLLEEAMEKSGGVGVLAKTHGDFAFASVCIFGVIASAYFIRLTRVLPSFAKLPPKFATACTTASDALLKTPAILLLALVGFGTLSITGALGGAMVYGPQSDPLATWLYNFIIN